MRSPFVVLALVLAALGPAAAGDPIRPGVTVREWEVPQPPLVIDRPPRVFREVVQVYEVTPRARPVEFAAPEFAAPAYYAPAYHPPARPMPAAADCPGCRAADGRRVDVERVGLFGRRRVTVTGGGSAWVGPFGGVRGRN